MPIPRKYLIDSDAPGVYHCISRCVRHAALCAHEHDHRRMWLHERLVQLNETFAIDVLGYALMSNHLHVILSTDPERADSWSPKDVARRFVRLFPCKVDTLMKRPECRRRSRRVVEREYISELVCQRSFIRKWRNRLASVSWHQKLLKEPIARRANQEDGCTGHFWEQRFHSVRLLDERAVLTCMTYIDLNPLRAGVCSTLEGARHVSIRERINTLDSKADERTISRRKGRNRSKARRAKRPLRRNAVEWLVPIEQLFRITTASYVRFVASVGVVRVPRLAAVAKTQLLGLAPGQLRRLFSGVRRWYGTAMGSNEKLHQETARRRAAAGSTLLYKRIVAPMHVG